MSKFVIVSDSHLATYPGSSVRDDGANQRLIDVVGALDFVLETAVEVGAKAIIHCGDFFHDRKAVKPEVLHRAGEWLDRVHAQGIPLHLLVGNHDLSVGGWRASSVRALAGRATIHDTTKVISIDSVPFGFLPYTEDPEVVAAGADRLMQKGAHALIAHLGIGDPKFSECVPVDYEVPGRISLNDLRTDHFMQTFIGHYHRAQDLTPNCRYIGSPLQLSVKEAGCDKRCLVWNARTNTVTTVLNTVSPQYRIVTTAAEAKAAPVNDFVVVKAKNREEADAAMEVAKERGNMRVDRIPPPATKARIDTSLPDLDLIAAYVATREVNSDERAGVISLGAEILAHASARTA